MSVSDCDVLSTAYCFVLVISVNQVTVGTALYHDDRLNEELIFYLRFGQNQKITLQSTVKSITSIITPGSFLPVLPTDGWTSVICVGNFVHGCHVISWHDISCWHSSVLWPSDPADLWMSGDFGTHGAMEHKDPTTPMRDNILGRLTL